MLCACVCHAQTGFFYGDDFVIVENPRFSSCFLSFLELAKPVLSANGATERARKRNGEGKEGRKEI